MTSSLDGGSKESIVADKTKNCCLTCFPYLFTPTHGSLHSSEGHETLKDVKTSMENPKGPVYSSSAESNL